MNNLINTLMRRDSITKREAIDLCLEYDTEDDPEDFLHDSLGLEPDYVFDLLDVVEMYSNTPVSV